jgi:hypothetical protein
MAAADAGVGTKRAVSGWSWEGLRHKYKEAQAQEAFWNNYTFTMKH